MLPGLAGLFAAMVAAAWCARHSGRRNPSGLDASTGIQINGSMIATFYGVLLALLLFDQVNDHQEIEKRLRHEAWETLFLFHLGESVTDAKARTQWESAVRDLAQSVLTVEWPAMESRHTRSLVASGRHTDPLWKVLMDFHTPDPRSQLLLNRATESYATLLESRRERLNSVSAPLHPVLWFGLIVGGMFTLFICISSAGPGHTATVAAAMSTGLVYLLLWLVSQYQRPFEGPLAISPEPYVRALEQMALPGGNAAQRR